MLQYPPSLSWTDGVFLRPHHFQQAQQSHAMTRNSDLCLALPYAYGLAQLEIDETALEHFHFSIRSLQAILPGGESVDLPRNAVAEALDLSSELSSASSLTVYLAVAPLREGEDNLSAGAAAGSPPRRYEAQPQPCYDINAGGNEQPIMFRRLRLLLSTRPETLPGYEKLPLMRLRCRRSADGRPSLLFFSSCRQTLDDLRDIQSDENDPNDCAREPHEVTHRVDAVRYYCISRVLAAGKEPAAAAAPADEEGIPYDEFILGGSPAAGYLNYGGYF